MIYGNKFLPKEDISTESASMRDFGIESVVYNEYYNYLSLLENCKDETNKCILEAQVSILYEVSVKDIFNIISKAIRFIIKKIKELIKMIQSYISKSFKPFDSDKVIKLYNKLKSNGILNENYILESSKVDKEFYNFVKEMCDVDIIYFRVKDYYTDRTPELKELDDAMMCYTKEMKDPGYFGNELINNFSQFKEKYYKGNKETEFSLYKSDKAKNLLDLYTEPTELIEKMIKDEKSINKLDNFIDLFERIREIKDNANKEKELEKLSIDLEKKAKKLESLFDEVKSKIEKNEYDAAYKQMISEFNELVKFNINCYNNAASYLKTLSTYVLNSYNEAKSITNKSYSIMQKIYYIVDKEK